MREKYIFKHHEEYYFSKQVMVFMREHYRVLVAVIVKKVMTKIHLPFWQQHFKLPYMKEPLQKGKIRLNPRLRSW